MPEGPALDAEVDRVDGVVLVGCFFSFLVCDSSHDYVNRRPGERVENEQDGILLT